MLALLGALSFLAAFAAVRVLLSRFRRFALDVPNARSLHSRPVPRTGGIAVLLGAAVSLGFGGATLWVPLAIAFALAVVSLADDLYRLPRIARLAAHIAAAAGLAWYVLSPINALEMALIVAGIAWTTNLYNFMDGSDGLAGGMAVVGFATYAGASWLSAEGPLAAVCVALAAASAAFLIHNLHLARMFLGDVGSIPLGFLAGALGVMGWRNDAWPLWFPVLVFAPFIADATVTLLKRVIRGERFWQAHRGHYYQRMVLMGLGHRGTACAAFVLMVVCAIAALGGRNQAPAVQACVFIGMLAVIACIAVWIDRRWAQHVRTAGGTA
jgi:UDP-N-acetylmuramyl pentapeptide phosphotransferase/UDP-N-acetylglucosamine-1-phosphate transferase